MRILAVAALLTALVACGGELDPLPTCPVELSYEAGEPGLQRGLRGALERVERIEWTSETGDRFFAPLPADGSCSLEGVQALACDPVATCCSAQVQELIDCSGFGQY